MTVLPSLLERQAKNIDTHERAIVFAALLLRKANNAPDNMGINSAKYKNAIRISTLEAQDTVSGLISANIIIEAKLPYNSQDALKMGGNFIQNINAFSSYSVSIENIPILLSNNTNLGDDLDYVNTLERYFTYHSFQWQKALNNDGDLDIFKKVKIQFFEEDSTEPSLKISLSIPYIYENYLMFGDLLRAVDNIASVLPYVPTGELSYLSNGSYISNDFYLNNGV